MKAGHARRCLGCGPARPACYGEDWIVQSPVSKDAIAHPPITTPHKRCCSHAVKVSKSPYASGEQLMTDAVSEGHERAAYATLDTSWSTGTRDRLRGASPRATEPP